MRQGLSRDGCGSGGRVHDGIAPHGKGRMPDEGPQHRVTIAKPFAVSKYDVTFNDWDACVSVGGCPREGRAGDVDWGRDTRPVIYVSWDDARQYVAWLSQMIGKPYRLLSDAEFEYAGQGESIFGEGCGQIAPRTGARS